MIPSTRRIAIVCITVVFLLTAVAVRTWLMTCKGGEKHEFLRNLLVEDEEEAEVAIVEGRVWLDLNRNGIPDEDELGVEDVIVELRTLHDSVIDAAETGSDGVFQFVIDEQDLYEESLGEMEYFVKVFAPGGFEFALPASTEDLELRGAAYLPTREAGASSLFKIVVGETYNVDTGVVSLCDSSVGYITFDGIKTASAFEPGSVYIDWEPATLNSYDESNPLFCGENSLLYYVYLAQAPYDFSPLTSAELLELASTRSDIQRVVTDEHSVVVDDLEPHDILSIVVVAKAHGLVSANRECRTVDVDEGMAHDDCADEDVDRELVQEVEIVSRRAKESQALINEILYLPDTSSPQFSKRRIFIEIYRPDVLNLIGCRLENDGGSFKLEFGDEFENTYAPYYSIKHKATLNSDFLIWRRKRIIWVRGLDLNKIDGVALTCEDRILDYVEWGQDGVGPSGALHDAAIAAGAWTKDSFVETGPVDFGGGYVSQGLQKGDSLGRDKESTDTNSKSDWSYPGGADARVPTPASQNLDHSALPVLNEVLFDPKTGAKQFYRRRIFVEIYRRDTAFSLNGCTIQNHDGSWRFDFDERFDSVDHPFITIKHKSTLRKESFLWRSRGILWMRSMPLEEIDAVALFCDGTMIDYLSWSQDGVGWNDALHKSAVANGVWKDTAEHIETAGIKKGASLGRDAVSTNTNSIQDWSYPGGTHATRSTPSTRNAHPLNLCSSLCPDIVACGEDLSPLPLLTDEAQCVLDCVGAAELDLETVACYFNALQKSCKAEEVELCHPPFDGTTRDLPDPPTFPDEQPMFLPIDLMLCAPGSSCPVIDVKNAIEIYVGYLNAHFPDSVCSLAFLPARGDPSFDFIIDEDFLMEHVDETFLEIDDNDEYMLNSAACGNSDPDQIGLITDIDLSGVADDPILPCERCPDCPESAPCSGLMPFSECILDKEFGQCVRTVDTSCPLGFNCCKCKCNGKGGICAHISTAHSLYKHGVVEKEWDHILDKEKVDDVYWGPKFLKKLEHESCDEDGNRGKNNDQITKMHLADWSATYFLKKSIDFTEIFNPTRTALKTWCELLIKGHGEHDDCNFGLLRGKTGGHVMQVKNVNWDALRSCCIVEVENTGKQDKPAGTYECVPFKPGCQTWEVCSGKRNIKNTNGTNMCFWNDQMYQGADFSCFKRCLRFVWWFFWWLGLEIPPNMPGPALDCPNTTSATTITTTTKTTTTPITTRPVTTKTTATTTTSTPVPSASPSESPSPQPSPVPIETPGSSITQPPRTSAAPQSESPVFVRIPTGEGFPDGEEFPEGFADGNKGDEHEQQSRIGG